MELEVESDGLDNSVRASVSFVLITDDPLPIRLAQAITAVSGPEVYAWS